ncbi:hypothetical protein [Gymnodinialimonas sp. 57CJ19]|uniref:hypothetical protein n=1 Tax=Gymnodinialimonas sp. 57CJ19 TaxID=3138498 RepID=UPI00313433C8
MRLKSLCLALLFGLSALPAQALSPSNCGTIEEQAFTLLDAHFDIEVTQSPTSRATALPNGCVSTDLDVYVGELGLSFRVERLAYTGQNLLSWVRGEVVLPTELGLRLDGAMLIGQPAPELTWISDLAGPQTPARIDLQWRWHPETNRLDVDGLRVELHDGSTATLVLRGHAPGWTPYNTPLADLGHHTLAVDLLFNGLFERAVVAPMQANGIDASPFTFAMAAAGVQSLTHSAPRGFLSTASATAINAFTLSLPSPRGRLRLNLTSPEHFNLNAALFNLRTGIPFDVALPSGTSLQAIWTPRQ